jgi:hypothetical protein
MKRNLLSFLLLGVALTMSAQSLVKVKYQGAKPTINDFVSAYLAPAAADDEEAMECDGEAVAWLQQAWENHLKGQKQAEGVTVTADVKNGFVTIESKNSYDGDEQLIRVEMCYWNCADQKHKIFAFNEACFTNGKYSPGQFDGLVLFRYNNATKGMDTIADNGLAALYDSLAEGVMPSFALPRSGKDITATLWFPSGMKQQKILKWNGNGFSK